MRWKWGILSLLCAGWLSSLSYAATVSSPILYQGFDRLAFPCGADVLVFPDCRFTVFRGDSVVARGEIEVSLPGIAVSKPVTGSVQYTSESSDLAVIDCFEIDTVAQVRIGHLAHYEPDLMFVRRDSLSGQIRVEAVAYRDQIKMLYDFQTGRLDGIVTDYLPRLDGVNSKMLTARAAWAVMLAPVPSSRFVQDGILTTSLFYRFDPASLPLITDGDSAIAWNAISGGTAVTARRYPFNPDTGRRLLANMKDRPDQVTIAIDDKTHSRPAAYFADILSRDRVFARIVEGAEDADLALINVPLSAADDSLAIRSLIDRLIADTVPRRPINEEIAQAAFHLAGAGHQPDSVQRASSLGRAAQKLIDDVGVFPLYRPGLFFTYRPTLTEVQVTAAGKFDLSRLLVLIPPPYLREHFR